MSQPFTQKMKDEEVMAFIEKPRELAVVSHSVQTQRMIWDVNSTASMSLLPTIREGRVRSKLADRKKKPKLET